MNSYQLLHILFIGFGLYAIIHPNQLSTQNIETSYSVTDLIRGWGIYSVTIGALISYPQKKQQILLVCFYSSIIWHILIVYNSIWTSHHKQSIIANIIAIILAKKMLIF